MRTFMVIVIIACAITGLYFCVSNQPANAAPTELTAVDEEDVFPIDSTICRTAIHPNKETAIQRARYQVEQACMGQEGFIEYWISEDCELVLMGSLYVWRCTVCGYCNT